MIRWRLATLLLLGGLLIFLALAYRYLQYARPVGSGPGGPPVPLEPFAEVWSQQKVLLLGVGDSVTAGFGARRTHSYFALLAQNPEDAMYGATLEQARPWIENYRVRLDRMLDLLNERFPGGCDVFLADIYDPTDGVGDAGNAGLPPWPDGVRILAEYNAVIHQAAADRENVHVVPMYETFLGHGIHCTNWWRSTYCKEDPHYWHGFNLEDPNERGYDALRRIFLIEIAAVSDRFRDAASDGSTP